MTTESIAEKLSVSGMLDSEEFQQFLAILNLATQSAAELDKLFNRGQGNGAVNDLRVYSGAFIAGVGLEPEDENTDFTGSAMLLTPLSVNGINYSIIGMNAGVLKFGLSYDSGTVYAVDAIISGTIAAGVGSTVGDPANEHVAVSATSVQFKDGSTIYTDLTAGALTIGRVAASQNNVLISSGALSIRNNTTTRIGMTAAGVLTINDTAGAAVMTFDAAAGANLTTKLILSGASSALAIGTTPPTSATAGTGLWLDRTGFYSLSSSVQNLNIKSTGMSLRSQTYPGSAYVQWLAQDTGVVTGQLISDYGGAAVNTGLRVIGQAHDSGVKGYAALWAQDHNGNEIGTLYVSSSGFAQLESTAGTGSGTQGLSIVVEGNLTNTSNLVFSLANRSTGTVANGLGVAMDYKIENSTGVDQQAGYEEMTWLDKTNGSEDTQYKVVLKTAGTDVAAITLNGGAASLPGTLSVVGDFSVNTNKFNVTASNGNTAVAGRLTATTYLNIPSSGTLTIASGVITVTGSRHLVETQALAATDDLDTINGGSDGDILILSSVSSARDTTVKNSTGNIVCGSDRLLSSTGDRIVLQFNGTNWVMLSFADNA